MKVAFIAAPLTARSGVYRSARELVAEGRAQGQDWSLYLGVSSKASGQQPSDDPSWVVEGPMEPGGLRGVTALSRTLRAVPMVAEADIVVSLIPQTDMALALGKKPWVSYARGLPWPAQGEASAPKALVWRSLERLALRRAKAVWCTTEVLKREMALRQPVRIVPPGLDVVPRTWDGRGERGTAVWAARYNSDKNPQLFLDALAPLPAIEGVMYGSGELESSITAKAPENVRVAGWADPARLWDDAFVYVGTSHREAFGRSAVEAAMNGIPVVLADSFGCAPLLVTDEELRDLLVLPREDVARWTSVLGLLASDEDLRVRVSDHLVTNAAKLTVAGSARSVRAALDESSPAQR